MYMHVYSHVFDVWFHTSSTVVYTTFLKLSECKRNPRKQVIVKKVYEEITEINDYILLIFKFL